jgi:Tol biopolymer transport system component
MSPRGAQLAAAALALGALVGFAGHAGTASGTAVRAAGYRIVLESDFDRSYRGYTIRPDGSGLTPLLPLNRKLIPFDVSRDGRTIAYFGTGASAIHVSRGSGAGLHFVVRVRDRLGLWDAALSPDGRMVAYSVEKPALSVVQTNGRGRRVLARVRASDIAWAPDGRALAYRVGKSLHNTLLVHPLRGKPHVLGRNGEGLKWSPDGRWITYGTEAGVIVVRPDGSRRHRLALRGAVAWSPDGRRIAGSGRQPGAIVVVGVDGRVSRRIRLPADSLNTGAIVWAPGGRSLLVERGYEPTQIWMVWVDGRAPRQVTHLGGNTLVGWTRLGPTQRAVPPLLPTERVANARLVESRAPIDHLSADGDRVAFAVSATAADCSHPVVWAPSTGSLTRPYAVGACGEWPPRAGIYDLELAGSREAWSSEAGCGNFCTNTLSTAVVGEQRTQKVASTTEAAGEPRDFRLRGDGDLLVFDDGSRLVRIGSGAEACQVGSPARICTTLRHGDHAAPVDSVARGLIAVRESDAVVVLDDHGSLIRVFPFAADEIRAARLDGGRLVVSRAGVVEVYDVATGAGLLQRPVPARFQLVDVDGGTAVLVRDNVAMLLRLQDGRSRTLTPGRGPVFADLEPAGLFYSYRTPSGGGRVAFLPRAEAEPAERAR